MPSEHIFTTANQFTQLVPPASSSGVRTSTTYASASGYWGCLFLLDVGNIAAGGTLTMQVVQAKDAAGTGSKNVTGANLATITDAGGGTAGISNSLYSVEFRKTELDIPNGFTYVGVTVTAAVAASLSGVSLIQTRAQAMPVVSNLVQRVIL
jgi:hypothetical protein